MIAEPPLDAPDEDWLVWADAMQQIGDPRGELLALGHPTPFVKHHAEALFGRVVGRHVRKGHLRVTKWRRYLADEIELRVDDATLGPQLVVDLLGSPVATTLRGISVAGVASPQGGGLDLAPTLGWLRESVLPPSLVSLALVDDRARAVASFVSRNFEPDPNLVSFGPLAGLWAAFAGQLERLTMIVADPGQIQFQALRLPNLRAFTLHPLCWVEGLGDMIANARWPALRSLDLRLTDSFIQNNPTDAGAYRPIYRHERERDPIEHPGNTIRSRWREELAPIFSAIAELPLERLALTSFADVYGVLDALQRATLPRTLVELDLSDSAFDDVGAARLADHVVMLQLKRLVLERVRLATPRALDGFGVEIVHSCAPAAPTYRYIIGME